MTDQVSITRDGAHLALRLTRPAQRNALTVAMYAALADAVEQANNDDQVRVISICGEGEDFTAGNDLADFLQEMPDPSSGIDIPVWRFLKAMARNQVPIVAAVHGNAIGIGTTMLLHCDVVICERTARLKMPFVDLGLVPEAASSLILPLLAGRREAARLILLAETFDGEEARAAGIASHLVESGEAKAKLDEIVASLLAKPVEALKLSQALLRRSGEAEVLKRMDLENGHFAERLQSDEVRKIIMKFFAEREAAKKAG